MAVHTYNCFTRANNWTLSQFYFYCHPFFNLYWKTLLFPFFSLKITYIWLPSLPKDAILLNFGGSDFYLKLNLPKVCEKTIYFWDYNRLMQKKNITAKNCISERFSKATKIIDEYKYLNIWIKWPSNIICIPIC